MNALSVSHAITKNQSESSWEDDPFSLRGLKGFVTGVTAVNHQRSLDDQTQELVARYAKYSFDQYELTLDMLPEYEQNELARLYIESIDRQIEWACYGDDESINSEFLCAMLAMLKNDCQETRQKFSEITRRNILYYYKDILNEILENACNDYHLHIMNEQGYYSHRDLDQGDIEWRKLR